MIQFLDKALPLNILLTVGWESQLEYVYCFVFTVDIRTQKLHIILRLLARAIQQDISVFCWRCFQSTMNILSSQLYCLLFSSAACRSAAFQEFCSSSTHCFCSLDYCSNRVRLSLHCCIWAKRSLTLVWGRSS